MKRPIATVGRLVLLLGGVVTAGVAVLALAAPWLPFGSAAASHGDPGFADLVASTCALALVACWVWLALGSVLVAVRALHPRSWAARWRLRWVPRVIRVVVPVLAGAAVTAAPVSAATDGGPAHLVGEGATRALAGLPLPDRVSTGTREQRTVVVRPGDSLWRIAARLLPDTAPDDDVDRGWRRLARANSARVPDPDLIHPGTRLRVPPLAAHPREEAS